MSQTQVNIRPQPQSQPQTQTDDIDHTLASEDQLFEKLLGIEDVLGELYFKILGGSMGNSTQQSTEINPQDISDAIQKALGDKTQTSSAADLNAFKQQLLDDVDRKFDQKSAAIVEDIIKAQKEGRPFYMSPIFLGGVAAAVVISIGGILYLYRQDIKELKELALPAQ